MPILNAAEISTILSNVLAQLSFVPEQPIVFSSGLFWCLFLLFLPVYAMLFRRRVAMMAFVVAFSLYFYYKCSGWCVLLLLATSGTDWYLARLIYAAQPGQKRRWLMIISVAVSLSVLAFFKYSNFIVWNFQAIIGGNFQPLDIVLPVGISFYTFRSISYVADVYLAKIKPENDYLTYLFYLSFFPCLIAGPIVRAADFLPQLRSLKAPTRAMVYGGLWLVIIGVFKKAVVADYIAQYNNLIFGNPGGYGSFESFMGVLGYSMQIYCDFSGYSDMAIGIARIMGFDLGLNFDFPYKSRNVTEFWRRWHISLSSWLRDYVYIPLGGNRHGTMRRHLNLMITMLLGGLWHGAAWKFVVWGAGHGAGLCFHKAMMPLFARISPNNYAWKLLSWISTFCFVTLLWIFFRADSFADACAIIATIARGGDTWHGIMTFIVTRHTWCFMVALVTVLHFIPRIFYDDLQDWFINSLWITKFLVFLALVQLVIEFASAEVAPFIYASF